MDLLLVALLVAMAAVAVRAIRVVRGRCVDCDADVDLYFMLPKLLN